MKRAKVVGAWGVMAIATVLACREELPGGDPNTPANSPLPKIERRESDPKSEPSPKGPDTTRSPSLGDAG